MWKSFLTSLSMLITLLLKPKLHGVCLSVHRLTFDNFSSKVKIEILSQYYIEYQKIFIKFYKLNDAQKERDLKFIFQVQWRTLFCSSYYRCN